MKKISYLFEYFITLLVILIFRLMPMNFVSLIGGKLFQALGPFSKSHKTALLNINKVLPDIDDREKIKIVSKSWKNLGKTLIELIILNKILNKKNKRITVSGLQYLTKIIKRNEQVIFFGIHQANWEILVPTIDELGVSVGAIYRHINNPYINNLLKNIRSKTLKNNNTFYTPKGKESAKEILFAINQGHSIILLIDQKDSAGNDVNLFNIKVKTQTGFLKIAKKNNLKLIPVEVVRKKINNFQINFHNPINPFDNNQDEIKAMSDIHTIIEKWIMKNPEQWLWQHNRFN